MLLKAESPHFMAFTFFNRWLSPPHASGINLVASDESSGPKDAEAQFSLAQKFGTGPDSDPARAMQWYRKAAEQGHCTAQFHLALMCAQGKGVVRNEAAALMWLRRAAEAGHGGAQYHLGVRLHHASKNKIGNEASELRIASLVWLQRAVAQSCSGAESAREFVLLGMKREEVKEGERRAQSPAAGPGESAASPIVDIL